jgi:hypothetical protein
VLDHDDAGIEGQGLGLVCESWPHACIAALDETVKALQAINDSISWLMLHSASLGTAALPPAVPTAL